MSIVFDPSAQMYVCIRARGIVGYGATPQEAEAMADAAEAAQAERARRALAARVPRYRYNERAMRYEIVVNGVSQKMNFQ